jgi:glycosyltransferase involved in cell wall biosynthesis
MYDEEVCGFSLADFDELDDFINGVNIKKIIINEVVSFDDVYAVLDYITGLKTGIGAKLIMLGHDFYSVCPSIYLIDNHGRHCFKPDIEDCERCIVNNKDSFSLNFGTMQKWRKKWGEFLSVCDEVTLFSENTKSYFLHHYPQLKNIKVVPHKVDYIPKIERYETNNDRLVIGILGNFMRTKGSEVVFEMLDIIDEKRLPIDILVIGSNMEQKTHKKLRTTGRYKVEDIPSIMKDNKVDIIFIASIWPETFSYTTQEVINMGLPIASFDIGAPAERIAKYDKGLVINEMTAEAALKQISKFMEKGWQ